MNKININKKSIVIVFLITILCVIAVFMNIFQKQNDDFDVSSNDEIQNFTNNMEESKQPNNEDNYIYVHIIGEIKNAGIVKLHER